MGEFGAQPKAFSNSGMLDSGPRARQRGGACSLRSTWDRSASGRVQVGELPA